MQTSISTSNRPKIRSFTDLIAWRKGHELVLMIYKGTKNFPREEEFGLKSQMRRAVVSITSNIAEGFSRRSSKEKAQFYSIALGSTTEIQNQILISKDIGCIDSQIFTQISEQSIIVAKILHSLITATLQGSFKIPASNV